MGLATRRDIEVLTKELVGKYNGFLKDIKLEHNFETDMVHMYIVFHPEDKTDGTWLAADYVKVASEVVEGFLGVSLRTLRQLGITPELTSTVLGRCIYCQIDATTRHILLNGMDDPFDLKLALMDELARLSKLPPPVISSPSPSYLPGTTVGIGSGLGGAIGTAIPNPAWTMVGGGGSGGAGGYSVMTKNVSGKTATIIKTDDGKWIIVDE